MDNKIIVRNCKRVSDYFDLEISTENLLERKEDKIKKFLDEYNSILFEDSYDKFKVFTKYTGMSFTRIYHKKDNKFLNVYLDEKGISANRNNDYNIPFDTHHIFKNHLTVHVYVDDFYEENGTIYTVNDNVKNLIYKKNKEYEEYLKCEIEIRRIINDNELTLEKKVELINNINPNTFLSKIETSKIKQIECIYPFDDILILTSNGYLFINDYLYSENVREIYSLTSYRSYIIYDNNDIEEYTSILFDGDNWICNMKKVICGLSFIAFLNYKREVYIMTVPSCYSDQDIDFDYTMYFSFYNIIDFDYDDNIEEEKLILKSNNEEIIFKPNIFVCR